MGLIPANQEVRQANSSLDACRQDRRGADPGGQRGDEEVNGCGRQISGGSIIATAFFVAAHSQPSRAAVLMRRLKGQVIQSLRCQPEVGRVEFNTDESTALFEGNKTGGTRAHEGVKHNPSNRTAGADTWAN